MNTPVRPLNSAYVIDDHPLFCDALSLTLRAVAGVTVIEAHDRLETAMARLAAGPDRDAPDVIVLDLHLPDVSGLDGLIRLKKLAADIPIVVVSSMNDHRIIVASIRAGAAGFVPKHSHREVFRAAFDAIRQGQTFVPDGVEVLPPSAQPVTDREEALRRLGLLTRQQGNILQLICEGKLNKQIAFDLNIAETTVKAHVTAIMRKLGVHSRTQAVLIAQEASYSSVLQDGR